MKTLSRQLMVRIVALMLAMGLAMGLVSVVVMRQVATSRLDDQLRHTTQMLQGPGGIRLDGPTHLEIVQLVVTGDAAAGQHADTSGNVSAVSVEDAQTLLDEAGDFTRPETVQLSYGSFRAVKETSGDAAVVVALSTSEVDATTRNLAMILLNVGAISVAVTALIASRLIDRRIAPIRDMADTAQRVSARELGAGDVDIPERVPDPDPTVAAEVASMGESLNRLLDTVESALTARQRSEMKLRQFSADASHELRTPLAAIRGYTELASRNQDRLSDEQSAALARIGDSAERMGSLVEDLLLLARLDNGQPLRRDEVDLNRIVVEATSDAQVAYSDHDWVIDIAGFDVIARGDEGRLTQVVTNLVRNAGIHTPAGTRVVVSTGGDETGTWIQVNDDGPGIAPDIPIFERFTRGDSSRSRSSSGSTGLGLSICQAIVEAHGGTILVDSDSHGTSFTVVLPSD